MPPPNLLYEAPNVEHRTKRIRRTLHELQGDLQMHYEFSLKGNWLDCNPKCPESHEGKQCTHYFVTEVLHRIVASGIMGQSIEIITIYAAYLDDGKIDGEPRKPIFIANYTGFSTNDDAFEDPNDADATYSYSRYELIFRKTLDEKTRLEKIGSFTSPPGLGSMIYDWYAVFDRGNTYFRSPQSCSVIEQQALDSLADSFDGTITTSPVPCFASHDLNESNTIEAKLLLFGFLNGRCGTAKEMLRAWPEQSQLPTLVEAIDQLPFEFRDDRMWADKGYDSPEGWEDEAPLWDDWQQRAQQLVPGLQLEGHQHIRTFGELNTFAKTLLATESVD